MKCSCYGAGSNLPRSLSSRKCLKTALLACSDHIRRSKAISHFPVRRFFFVLAVSASRSTRGDAKYLKLFG